MESEGSQTEESEDGDDMEEGDEIESDETDFDNRRGKRCHEVLKLMDSGGTTGVQTVHRTGAHGPRGPIQAHTIRQSQYNTPLLSANCLFINGPIINNIFLKIMDTLFRFYS